MGERNFLSYFSTGSLFLFVLPLSVAGNRKNKVMMCSKRSTILVNFRPSSNEDVDTAAKTLSCLPI